LAYENALNHDWARVPIAKPVTFAEYAPSLGENQTGSRAMIRSLLRFLGLVTLAAGFISFIYDATKSVADHTVMITQLGQTWSDLHQTSLVAARPWVEQHIGVWLWDPVIKTLLDQPTWAALLVVGAILILAGRRKKPLIGYARN
jgi:hypothetical protein